MTTEQKMQTNTGSPPTQEQWHQHIPSQITVLGLSKSGAAVARHARALGLDVFLSEYSPASEKNKDLMDELKSLGVTVEAGGHTQQCYDFSDLVIASPGIPPHSSIINQLKLSGKTIISEIEWAYAHSNLLVENQKAIPWVGITGTNGKSTTTTLVSTLLSASGEYAPACGNIGIPVTDVLNNSLSTSEKEVNKNPSTLVAELSSFQLEFSPTLKTDIAIWTNFSPDHLAWHGSLSAYEKAKAKLFTDAHTPRWAILNADDAACKRVGEKTKATICWFSQDYTTVKGNAHYASVNPDGYLVVKIDDNEQTFLHRSEIFLPGRHNVDNVLTAIAAAVIQKIDGKAINTVCKNFKGLAHRLEWVDIFTIANTPVDIFNDSKATSPEAAVSALKAFEDKKTPVILIAGGHDKNTPLTDFSACVKKNTLAVVLTGPAQDRFKRDLNGAGVSEVYGCNGLAESVEKALKLSQQLLQDNNTQHEKIAVLLSPACASFDEFRDFEQRGEVFKKTVQSLKPQYS